MILPMIHSQYKKIVTITMDIQLSACCHTRADLSYTLSQCTYSRYILFQGQEQRRKGTTTIPLVVVRSRMEK